MTLLYRYWLTRGQPHCLARWLSSSFSPLGGRAVSPVLLFRTPHTSDWSRFHSLTDQAAETHRGDVKETLERLFSRLEASTDKTHNLRIERGG
jgi:hypothetical protein